MANLIGNAHPEVADLLPVLPRVGQTFHDNGGLSAIKVFAGWDSERHFSTRYVSKSYTRNNYARRVCKDNDCKFLIVGKRCPVTGTVTVIKAQQHTCDPPPFTALSSRQKQGVARLKNKRAVIRYVVM